MIKRSVNILLLIFFFSGVSFAQEYWLMKHPYSFDYYITTEIKEGKIVGKTRRNALKETVGWLKFTMAKMTTSIKYPEIIYFEGNLKDTVINGDFYNLFSHKKFRGIIKSDILTITLIDRNGQKMRIRGLKVSRAKPMRDYSKIVQKIFKLTENNIYNQAFLKSKKWKRFKRKMNKLSQKIIDDLELQIAFSALARELPFSHYYLYRKKDMKKAKQPSQNYAKLREVDSKTCILKVKSFLGTKHQMDSLITIIDKKKYQNLIIDLRNNSGGNHLSAFPLAEYVIDKPTISGVFPNKNWYKEFGRIPTQKDYANFTSFSGGSMDEWFAKAQQNYGVYFRVIPSAKHFNGKVYVLTNRRTASTCEPLVYAFKYHNYATIIGEHTAGAMLSSNEFKIGDDIVLRIPLNDYVTYSGKRIDKKGIAPNIEVKSEKALEYVLDKINNE